MASAPPPTGPAGPWRWPVAELQGKKRQQRSSCPEGYLPAAIVVQLELTCRQERYARHCVSIARFIYNRMVANHQAGRDTGLWLTPHELEKEFNTAKHVKPKLAFATEVSKFVAQGRVVTTATPTPAGETRRSRPASLFSAGRTAPPPAPSSPPRALPAYGMTVTGASGCPIWAA